MEQSRIWDYFQNDDEVRGMAFNARPRYQHIAQTLERGMVVLNIGVGHGGLEMMLLERGIAVYCLDPSEKAIATIQKKLGSNQNARVGYSNAIPFEAGKFDAVVMTEVLEHLDTGTLVETLQEVKRVLRPDGRFMGTVPADENLLESRVMCPHCGVPFHRWGHVQSFDQQRLGALLRNTFGQAAISRHYFGDVLTLNWVGRLGWLAKSLLLKLGRAGSNETFFFAARSH